MNDWLTLLTPPPKKVRTGRYKRELVERRSPELKYAVALRICNQMFRQVPPAEEIDTLDRLEDEAQLTAIQAKVYLKKYKIENEIKDE